MKQLTKPQSFYFKINTNGTYGHARWIKGRRVFVLFYLTACGPLKGLEFRADDPALRHLRRLKNKPAAGKVAGAAGRL